jgi:hypothetical protein
MISAVCCRASECRGGLLHVHGARRRAPVPVSGLYTISPEQHQLLRAAWGREEVSGGRVSKGELLLPASSLVTVPLPHIHGRLASWVAWLMMMMMLTSLVESGCSGADEFLRGAWRGRAVQGGGVQQGGGGELPDVSDALGVPQETRVGAGDEHALVRDDQPGQEAAISRLACTRLHIAGVPDAGRSPASDAGWCHPRELRASLTRLVHLRLIRRRSLHATRLASSRVLVCFSGVLWAFSEA